MPIWPEGLATAAPPIRYYGMPSGTRAVKTSEASPDRCKFQGVLLIPPTTLTHAHPISIQYKWLSHARGMTQQKQRLQDEKRTQERIESPVAPGSELNTPAEAVTPT